MLIEVPFQRLPRHSRLVSLSEESGLLPPPPSSHHEKTKTLSPNNKSEKMASMGTPTAKIKSDGVGEGVEGKGERITRKNKQTSVSNCRKSGE